MKVGTPLMVNAMDLDSFELVQLCFSLANLNIYVSY